MRESAIASRTVPCSASGRPKATRDLARSTISASARSAMPMARMQWWMRPGPRRAWAIMKPSPSPARMLLAGTRTSVNRSSEWPCWSW